MTKTADENALRVELSNVLAGRFEVGAACGVGGQATVFRATRRRTSTGEIAADEVALKLYSEDAVDERVLREIETLTRVRHPCLAEMVEAGTVKVFGSNAHYIAFSFVDGETLAARLATRGALNLEGLVAVGRDVSIAINELWSSPARIVHRDVKPANIMLKLGERDAVLLDLGVSRYTGNAPITTAGMTLGTKGYMSPEQAFDETLTCLSDVFSLGIVLAESSCGSHPTSGKQTDLLKPMPIRTLLAGRAPGFVELVESMLSQEPSDRPTPLEVRDALVTLL